MCRLRAPEATDGNRLGDTHFVAPFVRWGVDLVLHNGVRGVAYAARELR